MIRKNVGKTVPIQSEIKQERRISKKKICFSFLTIILLILFIQMSIGAGLNVVKILSLSTKLNSLNGINKNATQKNIMLKEELEKYTSNKGVEALARNRLQMVGKNEVLVIIKGEKNGENDL